jgi:integrase
VSGVSKIQICSADPLYAIARFSKWLESRRVDLHEIDKVCVAQFLKRDAGINHGAEPAPRRRFLAILREFGVTQPWAYHCLLGLLAVTGLRISEALHLRCTNRRLVQGCSCSP